LDKTKQPTVTKLWAIESSLDITNLASLLMPARVFSICFCKETWHCRPSKYQLWWKHQWIFPLSQQLSYLIKETQPFERQTSILRDH